MGKKFRNLEYWLTSQNKEAQKWRETATVLELSDALHNYRQQGNASHFQIPQGRPQRRTVKLKKNQYFNIPEEEASDDGL